MKKDIDLIVFDPAGNTTLMVLTPVPRSEYAETAKELLKIDFDPFCDWRGTAYGEQVAYIVEEENDDVDIVPKMEMCGLEFCGNASRSYAYYRVIFRGEGEDIGNGKKKISVNVSGCPQPLTAVVDPKEKDSVIQMPLPVEVKMVDTSHVGVDGTFPYIRFEGISHLVLTGVKPEDDVFERLKNYFYEKIDPGMDAFGVMFIDEESDIMSPIVCVRDVDTTYHEGSCASGTAAAAVAKTTGETEGSYEYVFREPDGNLKAAVTKVAGEITEVRLGGIIEMTDVIHLEF